ncbi:hypothetical protein GCM10010472_56130 [Pseudonocardia halophobica]|uniref:Uncharacterized protein n=1 Tax=Pseudonocardia halophobica TaxID=29401 RepID=A0A9W6L860_9PSEU|nr:hypothetical protein GCM10017577_59870 [Pseudonocardia halophobica]
MDATVYEHVFEAETDTPIGYPAAPSGAPPARPGREGRAEVGQSSRPSLRSSGTS